MFSGFLHLVFDLYMLCCILTHQLHQIKKSNLYLLVREAEIRSGTEIEVFVCLFCFAHTHLRVLKYIRITVVTMTTYIFFIPFFFQTRLTNADVFNETFSKISVKSWSVIVHLLPLCLAGNFDPNLSHPQLQPGSSPVSLPFGSPLKIASQKTLTRTNIHAYSWLGRIVILSFVLPLM